MFRTNFDNIWKGVNLKVNYNSNIKFGMALHVNTKAIRSTMGNMLADAVEQKRPNLEKLAKNCYVKICPRKIGCTDYFDITAKKSKWDILFKKLQAVVLKQECVYDDVCPATPLMRTVKSLVSGL